MEALLIGLICLCVVIGIVYFILSKIPLPAPFNWLVWVVLGLIALVAFLDYAPLPHGRF